VIYSHWTLFFCLFSLLTPRRVLYEYKKSDIHPFSLFFFSFFCVYAALSLVRWFACAHHHSYYCIKMQICECVREKKKKKTELVLRVNFSCCKTRAFCWKCSPSIVYFLLLLISFLSIKLILTFLSKWYFH